VCRGCSGGTLAHARVLDAELRRFAQEAQAGALGEAWAAISGDRAEIVLGLVADAMAAHAGVEGQRSRRAWAAE
jgi:hypothetical protein